MAGLRSEKEILKAFEGLDKAPGSKKSRREPNEVSKRKRQQILGETNGWDANPIKKTLHGEEVDVFTIGALAQALEKQIVTIRLWERKGYIPSAPYRLRSKNLKGQKVGGNRVYTRRLIEIAIEEFGKRGLLGSARVEWKHHDDLTDALLLRWKKSVENQESSDSN